MGRGTHSAGTRKSRLILCFALLASALLPLAVLNADIRYFWLDKPTGRNNPHDPSSPLFRPSATPAATVVLGTPTISATVTPTLSPTPHGPIITDAESGDRSQWGGNVYSVADPYGSTALPAPFLPTAGGSPLPGGTPGNCFCLNGNLVATVGTNYSFTQITVELKKGWTQSQAGVDIGPYLVDDNLSFSFKANVVGPTFEVQMTTGGVLDFGYYASTFTPADTAWHRYTIYMPGDARAPRFAQPIWAVQRSWMAPSLQRSTVGAFNFAPVSSGSAQAYDFCIDDLTFGDMGPGSPTPSSTAIPSASPSPSISPTATPAPGSPTVSPTPSQTPSPSPSLSATPSWTQTQTPAPTATPSQSFTASPSPSQTPTPPASATASPSATFTPTLSASATASPSATCTPTLTPGPPTDWPVLYSAALPSYYFSPLGAAACVTVTGTGPSGSSAVFAQITASCPAGGYSAGGVFATGYDTSGDPLAENATAYGSLSVSVQVSAALGGCMDPGINVTCYNAGTGVTKTSATVPLDTYLLGQPNGTEMVSGAWYTALIPVAAFEGFNGSASPYSATITAGDMAQVTSVEIQPLNYGLAGAVSTQFNATDVLFTSAASQTATAAACNNCNDVFSDFENGVADNWGGFWSAVADSVSGSATCAGYMAPPISPNYTVENYSAVTDVPPASAGDLTPCHAGHLSGWLGMYNGPYGAPVCGASDYSYLQLVANFTNSGAPVNFSGPGFVNTLTAAGARGVSFRLLLGPNDSRGNAAGASYCVFIDTSTASGGNMYYVLISDASLSKAAWTTFSVPFPSDGDTASPTSTGTAPPGSGTSLHTDQGSSSELWWGQDQYASPVAWSRAGFVNMGVGACVRGMQGDVFIDDISFY